MRCKNGFGQGSMKSEGDKVVNISPKTHCILTDNNTNTYWATLRGTRQAALGMSLTSCTQQYLRLVLEYSLQFCHHSSPSPQLKKWVKKLERGQSYQDGLGPKANYPRGEVEDLFSKVKAKGILRSHLQLTSWRALTMRTEPNTSCQQIIKLITRKLQTAAWKVQVEM